MVPLTPSPIQVADAGGDVDRPVGDVIGGVSVHEGDPVGDAKLVGPPPGQLDADGADIDTRARNMVVPGPGAEHLAAARGQVQQGVAGPQPDGATESGKLLSRERVDDPLIALANGVMTRKIHFQGS